MLGPVDAPLLLMDDGPIIETLPEPVVAILAVFSNSRACDTLRPYASEHFFTKPNTNAECIINLSCA
jgi:hypothetical protein